MTTTIAIDPKTLDDRALLAELRTLVGRTNDLEAELLEHLAEVDERRLYLPEHTSMFGFCVAELGFSEPSTENRLTVARAVTPAVRPPVVAPLAPDRYHVQFTASRALREDERGSAARGFGGCGGESEACRAEPP